MADIKDLARNTGVPLVTKKRLAAAEVTATDKTHVSEANSQAPAPDSGKFTKPYTPAERAKQAEALAKFLAARK